MPKIKNGKRFKKLPVKRKKDIERLHLEIDQITKQNKKYILHIARICKLPQANINLCYSILPFFSFAMIMIVI